MAFLVIQGSRASWRIQCQISKISKVCRVAFSYKSGNLSQKNGINSVFRGKLKHKCLMVRCRTLHLMQCSISLTPASTLLNSNWKCIFSMDMASDLTKQLPSPRESTAFLLSKLRLPTLLLEELLHQYSRNLCPCLMPILLSLTRLAFMLWIKCRRRTLRLLSQRTSKSPHLGKTLNTQPTHKYAKARSLQILRRSQKRARETGVFRELRGQSWWTSRRRTTEQMLN